MKVWRYLFIFLIAFFVTCTAEEAPAPSCFMILDYVGKNLPHEGVLRKNSYGFVYVDVDDAYIHKLITYIQELGFEEPPYFGDNSLGGAHISVMYARETKQYGIDEIAECGERISFIPKKCSIVHPPTWNEIDEVYLIAVEAPQLDEIRKKYGLPKQKYDFHITIGVKPKIAA